MLTVFWGRSSVGKGNATAAKSFPVDNVPAVREDVNTLEAGHLPRRFDSSVEGSGRCPVRVAMGVLRSNIIVSEDSFPQLHRLLHHGILEGSAPAARVRDRKAFDSQKQRGFCLRGHMLVVVPEAFIVGVIFPARDSRYILDICVRSIRRVCPEAGQKELALGHLRSFEADSRVGTNAKWHGWVAIWELP